MHREQREQGVNKGTMAYFTPGPHDGQFDQSLATSPPKGLKA